ncbi:MAG TPA: T9SS type A sorting domain-containing protein [Flavobacteriales bacterium]|nr:T9SS type A sorting domain-containing protein [Flavobacteriales bacterium]
MRYFYLFIFGSLSLTSKTQLVGADVYLKGNYVETAISGTWGYEGVNMTTSPAPPGFHPRPGGIFGIVSNIQMDGWVNFDGDFFTPGTPENGWGFELINGTTDIKESNNYAGPTTITGGITAYTATTTYVETTWQGSHTGAWDLDFEITYLLNAGDLYYTTIVTITNNEGITIPTLYYYRNIDPDNNQSLTGSYATTNTIVSQPAGASTVARVSATQSSPWSSYIAFYANGTDFRVSKGGFTNRDASDIWNATGGLIGTTGAVSTADEAISLAYKITNLAPGASHTFQYQVVFASGVTPAPANAFDIDYSNAGTVISGTVYDTVYNCGSVDMFVTGAAVGSYSWTWSPATGLSSSTGATTTCTATDTISYTLTGSNATDTVVLYTTVIPGVTPDISITDPGPQCSTYDLSTLVYSDLSASSTAFDLFLAEFPANAWDLSSAVAPGILTPTDTVYLMMTDTLTGCYDVEQVTIAWDNVIFDLAFTTTACTSATATAALTVIAGSIDSLAWSTGDTVLTVDSLPAGPFDVTVYGTGGCASTASGTIVTNAFTLTTASIEEGCNNGNGTAAVVWVSDSSDVYTYLWNNGAATASLTGLDAGYYWVTATNQDGCTFTDTVLVDSILTSFSLAVALFDATCSSCANGTIYTFLSGSPALPVTYAWSTGATTANLFALLPGTYWVTATDANGCTWADTFLVNYPTAVDAAIHESGVGVYPNPANDYVDVKTARPVQELIMTNADGRKIAVYTPVTNTYRLDISGLAKGIYLLQAKSDAGVSVVPLVKH